MQPTVLFMSCSPCNIYCITGGAGMRTVVRALTSHAGLPPMWPGFDIRTRHHMWVEFVVDFRPALRGFLRVLRFSSLLKNQHFRIPIRFGIFSCQPLDCYVSPSLNKVDLFYLFIYLPTNWSLKVTTF